MNVNYFFSDLVENEENKYDFIFIGSGFDARMTRLLDLLNPTGVNIVCLDFTRDGQDELRYQIKENNSNHYTSIPCESSKVDVKKFWNLKLGEARNVAVDISCISKPYFFFLIQLFRKNFGIKLVDIFFSEPKSYLFTDGLFDRFSSNSGATSSEAIPGYSGFAQSDAKKILVVLLGFDGSLSREIHEDVSPSQSYAINGFPAYGQKFKDISLLANESIVSDPNIKLLYARASNPFDIYNQLWQIKKSEGNCQIHIAPLGPKPMAVGACLFALHFPETRILYPMSDNIEKKYSEGVWQTWRYRLDLIT